MEQWVQKIVVPIAVAVLTIIGLWALVSKRADKIATPISHMCSRSDGQSR